VHDVGRGFYIDVGAADPDEDSVTRAFYERLRDGLTVTVACHKHAGTRRRLPETLRCDLQPGRQTHPRRHAAGAGRVKAQKNPIALGL
jgi:hypothetical protein